MLCLVCHLRPLFCEHSSTWTGFIAELLQGSIAVPVPLRCTRKFFGQEINKCTHTKGQVSCWRVYGVGLCNGPLVVRQHGNKIATPNGIGGDKGRLNDQAHAMRGRIAKEVAATGYQGCTYRHELALTVAVLITPLIRFRKISIYEAAMIPQESPFDPMEELFRSAFDPEAIAGRPLENVRPGGLGIHIMKSVMDRVSYARAEGGGMMLNMSKRRPR